MHKNAYEDMKMADAYSKLEFPGTYYLAYRDLPEIINKHVTGSKVLDFGCGAGRSTRFISNLGLKSVGVDISEEMINRAREIDKAGEYYLINDGDFSDFEPGSFDLVASIFTFDNIPTRKRKSRLLAELGKLLSDNGKILNLVSSPDIYVNEWASFTTKDFPENQNAKCGDIVKIINTDIEDDTPVDDIIWPDKDYRELYMEAGLKVEAVYKPLGKVDEPYHWISETEIPPWVIYVLSR